MKWLRALIAILVVVASAATIARFLLPQLKCNRDKGIVNTWTAQLLRDGPGYERTAKARELAELCRRCLDRYPEDYEFHLLLGINEKFLGDYAEAEQSYRRALALNERPETYAYLVVLLLERGRPDEARANLYRAALFNMAVIEVVSEPLRTEVGTAVIEHQRKLGSTDALQLRPRRRRNANSALPGR